MPVAHETIIVEDRFDEIFAYLPEMTNSKLQVFKPRFEYGDNLELLAFLKNNKGATKRPYPLIWLEYPYNEPHFRTNVNLERISLILATSTNASHSNRQRLKENYKKVLIPLFENIKKAFLRANIISIDENYDITKFPNYGNIEENRSETIDLWDALKITFDCSINNRCLNKIKF